MAKKICWMKVMLIIILLGLLLKFLGGNINIGEMIDINKKKNNK